jgi:MFS superfamily sulfate permease-like transporter
MEKIPNPLLHFQILVAIWALIGIAIGFVMTCMLFITQAAREKKRPGINIREL